MSNPIVSYGNMMRWKFEDNTWSNIDEKKFTWKKSEPKYSGDFEFENLKWNFSIVVDAQMKFSLNFLSGNNEKNWLCFANIDSKLIGEKNSYTFKGFAKDAMFKADKLTHCLALEKQYFSDEKTVWIEVVFDFTYQRFSKKTNINYADMVLRVENIDLYVNKGMLCACSEYFMNLSEQNKKSYNIENANLEDFMYLLMLMHPSTMLMSDGFYSFFESKKFEKCLKLAESFKCTSVFSKIAMSIDAMLEKTDCDIKLVIKCIKLSEEYNLQNVEKRCLTALKTTQHVKDISKTHFFELLSAEMKVKILSRFLSI